MTSPFGSWDKWLLENEKETKEEPKEDPKLEDLRPIPLRRQRACCCCCIFEGCRTGTGNYTGFCDDHEDVLANLFTEGNLDKIAEKCGVIIVKTELDTTKTELDKTQKRDLPPLPSLRRKRSTHDFLDAPCKYPECIRGDNQNRSGFCDKHDRI